MIDMKITVIEDLDAALLSSENPTSVVVGLELHRLLRCAQYEPGNYVLERSAKADDPDRWRGLPVRLSRDLGEMEFSVKSERAEQGPPGGRPGNGLVLRIGVEGGRHE